MTPKEKAKQLVDQFDYCVQYDNCTEEPLMYLQVDCAKIVVNEIILAGNDVISDLIDGYHDDIFNNYWNEVEKELIKL